MFVSLQLERQMQNLLLYGYCFLVDAYPSNKLYTYILCRYIGTSLAICDGGATYFALIQVNIFSAPVDLNLAYLVRVAFHSNFNEKNFIFYLSFLWKSSNEYLKLCSR